MEVLAIVSILAIYGRHLARSLERRAFALGFVTIAQFFGTVRIDTIAAHLRRGLMRMIALESMWMRRALRGGSLQIQQPRAASSRAAAAKDAPVSGQSAGSAAPEVLTPE